MRNKIATPMPGSAMSEIASAASVIRRMAAQPLTLPLPLTGTLAELG
jgi:hypothetical protein